jgi:TonB family protein
MKVVFFKIVLSFFALQIFAQGNVLKVIQSLAPEKYPPAARAVRAFGEVKIQVEISEDGNVVSAKGISGHLLLQTVSIEAAKKWKFETKKRTQTIITFSYQSDEFVLIEEGFKESEYILKTNIEKETLHVEVISENQIPKLLLLPRENGLIPDKQCELHNQFMAIEIQETSKEFNYFNDDDFYYKKFQKAEKRYFPNAKLDTYLNYYRNQGIEKIEAYYCQVCRLKRTEWLKEQGKEDY